MRAIFFVAVVIVTFLSLGCGFVQCRSANSLVRLQRKGIVTVPLDRTLQRPPVNIFAVAEKESSITTNDSAVLPVSLPPLLKINALMMFFFSTLGAVMPFIPLYYRKIGISDAQIGILGAISPAVTFIVSPLWGALADSTGQHKNILLGTFIGSVLLRCLMGVVDSQNVLVLGIVVALSAILFAPVKPLLDSTALSMLEDKSTYGKSRLFGQMGFGMGSLLVGPLLGAHIKLIYLVQAVLAVPTMILMMSLPASAKPETPTAHQQHTQKQDFYILLRDPVVWCFFLTVFTIGLSTGIIENFAYVKISEVSGTGTKALTVSRLLSSLAGGPMFWLSGGIIRAIGTRAVMVLTMLAFVLRFTIYASITRGWHAIPAEILRGVSFALFWSAATAYAYEKAPKGLSATVLGLLNGIYGGLGMSIGSLIGGELVRTMGISAAFYRCAAVDGGLLLAFLLSQPVLQRIADRWTTVSVQQTKDNQT